MERRQLVGARQQPGQEQRGRLARELPALVLAQVLLLGPVLELVWELPVYLVAVQRLGQRPVRGPGPLPQMLPYWLGMALVLAGRRLPTQRRQYSRAVRQLAVVC